MARKTLGLPTICRERCRQMIALMDRACGLNGLSRRQLARQLGLTVSTVNAYYSGRVDPLRCKLFIQHRLAELNGCTVDELVRFYQTGDWREIGFREPSLPRPGLKGLRPGRPFKRLPQRKPSPMVRARINAMLEDIEVGFLPSKKQIDECIRECGVRLNPA